MVVTISLLLLLSGYLISLYLFEENSFLERVGTTLFFSITTVPFVNIHYIFITNRFSSNMLTLFVACIVIIIVALLLIAKHRRNISYLHKVSLPAITRKDIYAFTILCIIGIFSWFYYSNLQFILSLGSYVLKGEAECFYMQGFQTYGPLNPFGAHDTILIDVAKNICTPGNTLFTTTFLPLFKMHSFHILYVAFNVLLFIFLLLCLRKIVENELIALLTALFAVMNPYLLSIELLDRNVITLALSALFFYCVAYYRKKAFLHGILFGILAGTGLRFLGLLFIAPTLLLYYDGKVQIKNYIVFGVGFICTFVFNIPHLYFHGLHSLGETESVLTLIGAALTKGLRTPFMPFPNILFYIINVMNYFGYVVTGITLFGIFMLFRNNVRLACILLLLYVPILGVLSFQRNWIEGDKYRIITESFLPLYIFFAYGLKYVYERRRSVVRYCVLLLALLIPYLFTITMASALFTEDDSFYLRKYLYQRESDAYYKLTRRSLLDIPLLPHYSRLFHKADMRTKAVEEKVTINNLFPLNQLPKKDAYREFYDGWKKYFDVKLKNTSGAAGDYINVEVNFNKLMHDGNAAVRIVKTADLPTIDFEDADTLFDVYYAELDVTWQRKKLPVCVLIDDNNIKYLDRLYIELNAFKSYGQDGMGLDIVNAIHVLPDGVPEEMMMRTGMSTFPLFEEENKMIFRVPVGIKIIIRNWFIDGVDSTPYKIDGWEIVQQNDGMVKTQFYYNEPESYL